MKKKVLFFHFDLKGGGAEKVLINLVNSLDKEKYDITVKTIFGVGTHIANLAPHIRYEYVFKRQFPGFTYLQRLFSSKFLHRLLIKGKYDLEIAYIETSPTRIVSGCPYPDTKKMAWLHITLDRFPWFRGKKEMSRVYHSFDKVVSVSQDVQDAFINASGLSDLPFVVQRNVVDSEYILERAKEDIDITLDQGNLNICYIGRLIPAKDPMRLLEALKNIKSRGIENWHLYFLGKGELEQDIREYVSAHGLEGDVTMLGYQTNPYKYVSRMGLYVCSSHSEGYSTAATEALIMRVPVLTTDCGGMKEILENGRYGMLVADDDSALEQGLAKMIGEAEAYNHYKAMADERSSYFMKDTIVKENERLIEELIGNK